MGAFCTLGALRPNVFGSCHSKQRRHRTDLDGVVDQHAVPVGHEAPDAGVHRFLHPHFQTVAAQLHDGAGFAFTERLVHQREVPG
jgi:hypothetical protein